MAEVNLAIHGKTYGIACDEGQEKRVMEVGRYVDMRAREIASAGAAGNENHMLVLTALVLADEIKELQDALRTRGPVAATNGAPAAKISPEEEQRICNAINNLTLRIDSVAQRIAAA